MKSDGRQSVLQNMQLLARHVVTFLVVGALSACLADNPLAPEKSHSLSPAGVLLQKAVALEDVRITRTTDYTSTDIRGKKRSKHVKTSRTLTRAGVSLKHGEAAPVVPAMRQD